MIDIHVFTLLKKKDGKGRKGDLIRSEDECYPVNIPQSLSFFIPQFIAQHAFINLNVMDHKNAH